MNQAHFLDENAALTDPTRLPDGAEEAQTEHQVRTGIRDLIAIHGFEDARNLIALWLWNEAEGIREKRAA